MSKENLTAKVIADTESESGLSLVFPQEVFDKLGWDEGDIIDWSISNGAIKLTNKTKEESDD